MIRVLCSECCCCCCYFWGIWAECRQTDAGCPFKYRESSTPVITENNTCYQGERVTDFGYINDTLIQMSACAISDLTRNKYNITADKFNANNTLVVFCINLPQFAYMQMEQANAEQHQSIRLLPMKRIRKVMMLCTFSICPTSWGDSFLYVVYSKRNFLCMNNTDTILYVWIRHSTSIISSWCYTTLKYLFHAYAVIYIHIQRVLKKRWHPFYTYLNVNWAAAPPNAGANFTPRSVKLCLPRTCWTTWSPGV